MTTLDNSATSAFAVFSCNLAGESLHAVFSDEAAALREAVSCNQDDDENDYRVSPVTFTCAEKKEFRGYTKGATESSALALDAEHYYASEFPQQSELADPDRQAAIEGLEKYIDFFKKHAGLPV